ncbi:isovaleryl-CoA dehydrogenase [Cryptococcus wingfieldii CBS 7118]|uniref:Isovaleryl-CoA dehydrogenase n=1 Tax=Cryptococcus wingfieldii CBS 7118 TaxID=1295528 RepID=A0A1E3IM69_9TREE|nr:isovaleryl-CoA dehydrogenase [Cryptococcus wingfieldii CBS 7118]ODN89682.1 isovaleryl-CoA dehydrogenase [Cryptococcus wingfieldii CBS 7118]
MKLIPRSTSIIVVRPSSLVRSRTPFSAVRSCPSQVSGCRAFSSYNPAIAGLTANQEEFRDAVHTFAQKEIAPRAAKIDKTNKLPSDIFPKLGEMGLLGVTVPEKWGGLGLGYLEHTIAMEEISRASPSIGLSYGAHSNLMVNQLVRWGNEEQLSKYLPPLLTGEHVGSLAMSEPNAGSDVVSMRSNAVKGKEGEGWVLNGSKCWITNATVASTFLIYAKSDTSVAPSKGMTAFLVERGWKGFDVGKGLDKFGMRGSPTAELFFDNVNIPTSNVLGREGKGAGVLMSGLDLERLVLSGGPLGIMQSALNLALEYTHQRRQFGKQIGTFQLMQGKIAGKFYMYTKMSACRAYVYAVARACDAGKVSRQDCAGAILYSSDKAVEVAMEAQQCLGGNGYINGEASTFAPSELHRALFHRLTQLPADYAAGRLLRDSRLYTVGAGTQEIRRMLIGREFNVVFGNGE